MGDTLVGTPTKIVLLNGPPASGKSMATTFLRLDFPGQVVDPKDVLTRLVSYTFRLTHDQVMLFSQRAEKEVQRTQLLGLSWREALIWASEDVLKPKFGLDVIGQFAVAEIFTKNKANRLFFVDSVGFTEEALCYYKAFGPKNVITLRLFRDGKTFAGDSRQYIDKDVIQNLGGQVRDIQNRYELDLYREQIKVAINEWLGISE